MLPAMRPSLLLAPLFILFAACVTPTTATDVVGQCEAGSLPACLSYSSGLFSQWQRASQRKRPTDALETRLRSVAARICADRDVHCEDIPSARVEQIEAKIRRAGDGNLAFYVFSPPAAADGRWWRIATVSLTTFEARNAELLEAPSIRTRHERDGALAASRSACREPAKVWACGAWLALLQRDHYDALGVLSGHDVGRSYPAFEAGGAAEARLAVRRYATAIDQVCALAGTRCTIEPHESTPRYPPPPEGDGSDTVFVGADPKSCDALPCTGPEFVVRAGR